MIKSQNQTIKLIFTWKNCAGFTLTEVLIAAIILTTGLLGSLVVTISVIDNIRLSKQMTIATTLAQDMLERIKNTSYANVTQGNYPVEDYNTMSGFLQFRRTMTVIDNNPRNTKTITVTVSWKRFGSGVTRNVNLSTIISQ